MNGFAQRWEKASGEMRRRGLDCMLITPSSNMKYMTGYPNHADDRLLMAVFAPGFEPFIVANALYELSLAEVPYRDIRYWKDGEDPFELLHGELEARGIPMRRVAVDDITGFKFVLPLLRLYPDAEFSLACEVLSGLRIYKDEAEIELIKTACAKAELALARTMERGRDWIGHTENELFNALCTEMSNLGLGELDAGIAVGKNAAEPHHHHDDTLIEDNNSLLIDFVASYRNYRSDMTRMFYFGKPTQKFLEVYQVVNKARAAGIAAAKQGAMLEDVDRAARGVIEAAGYGPYFNHRTGHGIGIDSHEGPSAAAGEKTLIATGMLFSVEPGIYLPEEFGIRVEDQVLVGEQGGAALHSYPTALTVFE